ncbi:porin [Massilia sp. Se16.2.3]|uniref:porin n=1 Tax=Massilia sp. Se16.2.3 TaxID=2709303 RepID=UPI0015FEE287|nr:porin [Massilia sp. Se16.2.3]QNA99441.1 porin [Massilia sp. Se16.2.3]
MLKSLITFAVLGGSAAVACAQSGVTTYGVIDAGVVGQGGCAGNCATRVGGGVASESHIGIHGSEPVGGGATAIFAAETVVRADTGRADQGERPFGRQVWVGLAGEFGAITIGRQYNLQYLALTNVADPFKGGMAGSAGNLIGGGQRVDNSIQYYGALARGISAGASYAFREKVDTSPAGRAWGMTVGFEHGPLTLRAAHQNLNAVRVQFNSKTSNDTAARNSILAANLRLGWGTAYAAYSLSRGWASSPLFNPDNPYSAGLARTPSNNSRDVLVGLAVPVSQRTTLLTSYIQKDDRDLANQDANQMAIGASHAVSRRTDFYAAYSHIRNRNGAGYTVGNASSRGNGNSAFNVGMRHAF